MNQSFRRFLQVFFVLLDLAFLNILYLIVQRIFEEDPQSQYYMRYAQYWLLMNGFWLMLSWLGKVYDIDNIARFETFLKSTFRVYFIWASLNILYLFLPRLIPLSSPLVFTTVIAFAAILFLNRFIYFIIREFARREVYVKKKILILGFNRVSQKLAQYLENQSVGVNIMGFVDEREGLPATAKYPIFNNLDEILKISLDLKVNEIYSTIMPENNPKVYKIMNQADKDLIRFKIVPDFSFFINKPVHVDYLNDLPVLTVRREPLEEEINRFSKRAFDIFVSTCVMLFILSWLIPLIALLIKLESKGPVFFGQLRSGKNNQPFVCYKFRSMATNKETESVQATKDDKRVTRIGKFLRKTSLDEFPQFFNVFKGEMSVVGPRPHMLKHTEDFSLMDDDYMIRQFLKPGITGWAQVNGYRGEIKDLSHIKKRVQHDLWYLENWNLGLDVKIMFKTVFNAIKGEENAY